jgi:hypothetical protein
MIVHVVVCENNLGFQILIDNFPDFPNNISYRDYLVMIQVMKCDCFTDFSISCTELWQTTYHSDRDSKLGRLHRYMYAFTIIFSILLHNGK